MYVYINEIAENDDCISSSVLILFSHLKWKDGVKKETVKTERCILIRREENFNGAKNVTVERVIFFAIVCVFAIKQATRAVFDIANTLKN